MDEFQLNKICVALQAEDKAKRKQGLEELLEIVRQQESRAVQEIWQKVHRQVAQHLNDRAEACRDLSVNTLKAFLSILPIADRNLVYVIPILTKRLASQELVETSEEVRLSCVSLLRMIVSRYKNDLSAYIDDAIAILAKTVVDNYPNVKKESCACISDLAKATSDQFYSRSENLVKPILSNFTHQHFKVRAASVRTIGDVVQFGNNKSIEEVATPLAERLFDQSGAVRTAVIEISGRWLVELRDRYSWWHKLIPLLITGLHDEIEEIRKTAARLWDAAGRLYIEENKSDDKFKDKMDFLTDDPEHYPLNISRPNLGCRVIVQQNLCKLVGGIGVELGDWLADIRVRSAQLLCELVLNAEQDVTQHIEKLLPPMYRACNDEDHRVVVNVELAAEYMGYFVPPDIYCHLVVPTLEESPTAGHLRVFAAILRGSRREELAPKLEAIGSFLRQPHICQSTKTTYQNEILRCCESLLAVCKEDCATISECLFAIIFTVLSMATEGCAVSESESLLAALREIENVANTEELCARHVESLLLPMKDNCKAWTIHSADYRVFRALMTRAGSSVARRLNDLVFPVILETMGGDADPELRLKQFILLSDFFRRGRETFESRAMQSEFAQNFLDKIIVPQLIWTAGRTAEAIRAAVVCCLCALLDGETRGFLRSINLSTLLEEVVPILVTLADDNSKKTRLYSLRALYLITCPRDNSGRLTADHVHRMYPVMLKRLDDGCDDVRCAAVEALTELWTSLPEDYDVVFAKSHIDALYTSAIVHLDDPDPKFQTLALDALMRLATVHPRLLENKIQNCRANFRNQPGIDRLLERTRELLTQRLQ